VEVFASFTEEYSHEQRNERSMQSELQGVFVG